MFFTIQKYELFFVADQTPETDKYVHRQTENDKVVGGEGNFNKRRT